MLLIQIIKARLLLRVDAILLELSGVLLTSADTNLEITV